MRLLHIALAASLIACSGGREPPDGYIEACYGGDWSKHMVGKTPVYSVVLSIERSDWPKLKEILKVYAEREGLKHFDTSEESKALSMLYVSVCSQDGLWVHADKRIWRFEGKEDRSPLPLMVSVFVYANPDKWAQVPKDIDKKLRDAWPENVDSNHKIESSLRSSPL